MLNRWRWWNMKSCSKTSKGQLTSAATHWLRLIAHENGFALLATNLALDNVVHLWRHIAWHVHSGGFLRCRDLNKASSKKDAKLPLGKTRYQTRDRLDKS